MIGLALSCGQDVIIGHKDIIEIPKNGENMNPSDDHGLATEAVRDRLSRLSAAILRINESLDLDAVLQEVVDGACALTGAQYGGITTHDGSGQLREFVTHGLNDEERMGGDLGQEIELFMQVSRIQEPLRIGDLASYLESLSYTENLPPYKTFLGTQIRYRERHIGNFYLADKRSGQEFTEDDEEILVMFASQVALAIANARQHLREQRIRAGLETLIDTSPVAVLEFDAKSGALTYHNREARRIASELFGTAVTLEEAMSVIRVRRADGNEVKVGEIPLLVHMTDRGRVRVEEIVLVPPDGRTLTVLMNLTPISGEDGSVETFVVTIQDMTPLQEMERLRAEFLGMVSHELRTPLAAIMGSANTVLDEESTLDPAELRQFHRIIVEQADKMRALITDLLDVVRIETGTLPVNPGPAEVAVLVDEAKATFLNADGWNNLRIELMPDLPLVMADRRRIVQVLSNLLSNAARHSPESSVIRVTAARQGIHVAVSVSDEGSGISAERIPQLFRKFSRVEPEGQGGDTGLGLAVCKGIVEAHGGRIWAESEGLGRGTRLVFTLPAVDEVATIGPRPTPGRSVEIPRPNEDRPRILVVDDDPQMLRYVRGILSKTGYSPIVTADPDEVPRLIEDTEPRLVLLDLMLPDTDGIVLMETIRDLNEVPVIFISAYGQDEVIARAFEMGAYDYIVKPFSPTELTARIHAALRRSPSEFQHKFAEDYEFGDLIVGFERRTTTLGGFRLQLTPTEYRVLAELAANASRVLTHEQLLRRIWRQDRTGDSGPVRTIIRRLRRKLGDDAAAPTYIHTEPRVGYFMPAPEPADGSGEGRAPSAEPR